MREDINDGHPKKESKDGYQGRKLSKDTKDVYQR
jgi:hypothetical protein